MFHHSRLSLKHSLALELRRLRYGRPRKKVFCVGFQKTGTTSLQYALSLLGYRVAGIFSVRDLEDFDGVRARALDLAPRFDAFADNPWPLYFREFDAMFPGAKFILTARDPDKWYNSVCKHFGDESSQMREWIYGAGCPAGHRVAYVGKLLGHQDAVRHHFTGRPKDFMEFDVTQGDGWDKLCDFLGKPVPKKAFPQLNTARMRKVGTAR